MNIIALHQSHVEPAAIEDVRFEGGCCLHDGGGLVVAVPYRKDQGHGCLSVCLSVCLLVLYNVMKIVGWGRVCECVRVCACMHACLLYTSPSPRDMYKSRMPSSA